MSDAVLFDARDDGIAIITLNRPEQRNALSREIRQGLFDAWDRFERDPALRIAILTGAGEKAFCAGGWMIAQACDLCVASSSARFAVTEVKVGRSSPWAAPLIHMIPQRIMMEILLTGKPISAQRAYEIGLVNRLAEPDQLMACALELAAEVLDGAPLSVQAARDTVMLSTEMGRSAALRAARHASTHCYQSEDAQEGPRAFAEKRRPRWQGR